MNHCTLSVFHRSHFGSRYQSGRCALRSPFSKPCKFESPSCHFSFPFEKAVKTVCFYGLAKSRRVSTNVKKNARRRHSKKIKNDSGSNPIRIGFESDSNRIRIRFEPRCCTTRHMHKNAEKEERKRKRINTLDSYLNAKTKNTTHQRAR